MQKVIEQISSISLGGYLEEIGAKRVFLVTGKSSYISSGASALIESIENKSFDIFQFSDFDVNPKFEDVIKGTELFSRLECDAIIAIGGGSVIDVAKSINAFQSNYDVDYLDILTKSLIFRKGVPLIAIPTTAGSGSEATHFAVLYKDKAKYSIAHSFILPDAVGLNSGLITSSTPYQIACSGLDALSQAIESYWSVNSTSESKKYAKIAIDLIYKNLKDAVNLKEKVAIEQVAKGSFMAGKAINISKTTAPHALSYAFTTYFGVPHGHAVFLTLPKFLKFNYEVDEADCNDPRGPLYVKETIEEVCEVICKNSNPDQVMNLLMDFSLEIGVSLDLQRLNIKNYRELIVNSVNLERLQNNPKKISFEEISNLI